MRATRHPFASAKAAKLPGTTEGRRLTLRTKEFRDEQDPDRDHITVVGMGLIAAGCVTATSGEGTGVGVQAQGAPAVVEVMLSDFKIEPATISVPADTPLSVTVMNHGQAPHTFGVTIDGSSIETPTIDPDASAQLDLPALAAGSYDALCTVPGHMDMGMVATMIASSDAPVAVAGVTGAAAGVPSHTACRPSRWPPSTNKG